MLAKFQGFKTIVFNVVMTLVAVVLAINPELAIDPGTVSQGLDAIWAGLAVFWGAGSVILRWLTTTPIFTKE